MTTSDIQEKLPPPPAETPFERDARVRQETALIAKAEADIAAGLGLDGDDVEAWLDALDHDENAPGPR